jgi:hypothetical protein
MVLLHPASIITRLTPLHSTGPSHAPRAYCTFFPGGCCCCCRRAASIARTCSSREGCPALLPCPRACCCCAAAPRRSEASCTWKSKVWPTGFHNGSRGRVKGCNRAVPSALGQLASAWVNCIQLVPRPTVPVLALVRHRKHVAEQGAHHVGQGPPRDLLRALHARRRGAVARVDGRAVVSRRVEVRDHHEVDRKQKHRHERI